MEDNNQLDTATVDENLDLQTQQDENVTENHNSNDYDIGSLADNDFVESDYFNIDEQVHEDVSGDEQEAQPEQEEEVDTVDYKSFHKRFIGSPIKANGTEITIDSAEDLERLVQMGANYNHSMRALKPHRKTSALLSRHNIGEEQLSYLIDLHEGKEEAIQKFVRDKKIDTENINSEEELSYIPKSRDIPDNELELLRVVEEIKDSPYRDKTNDIMQSFDDASKEAIYENPTIVEVLHHHVANGIYEDVNADMVKLRALGKHSNVKDIDLYKAICEHKKQQASTNVQQKPPQQSVQQQQQTKTKPNYNSVKKTKTSNTNTNKQVKSLDRMSDDEFKQATAHLFR